MRKLSRSFCRRAIQRFVGPDPAERRHCLALLLTFVSCFLFAPFAFASGPPAAQTCPRPDVGSHVQNPPELRSQNGVLEVTLHFRYQATLAGQGPPRYCYATDDGLESPTLRLYPGDQLILHLHNDLPASILSQSHLPLTPAQRAEQTGCDASVMDGAMTNLHFHGLTIPPTCHQDEVIRTMVKPGDGFDYRVTIPRDEPPGLYWYHPHPHGFSERQVQGGASGALIVEVLNAAASLPADLPERVLVLRDLALSHVQQINARPPAWDISINYVPVLYPDFQPAKMEMVPSQKELWRVLNAGADTIFNLQLLAGGAAQPVRIIALDGVPVGASSSSRQTSVLLPPGARAEFVVDTPASGQSMQLVTTKWDTGPQGDSDPARPIADLVSDNHAAKAEQTPVAAEAKNHRWHPHNDGVPVVQRRFYFSQISPSPQDPDSSVFYFITEFGQVPAMYHMGQPPNIVVHEGDVEDWTIENRAQEDHVFHMHQIHFRVLAIDGKPVNDGTLRDTIDLPYWDGSGPYPSVKLRMDFRDPNTLGTSLYHCHILKHEDMGMMGVIQVLPPGVPTVTSLHGPAATGTATLISVIAAVSGKTGGGSGPLAGTMQFLIDGIIAGKPVAVVDGKATLTTSFDSAGIHVITAAYTGDKTYDVSASRPLKLKVTE